MLNDDCYPQEIFSNQNDIKKFICPIDYGVFHDPVLDSCGHSFGKFCISQWIKKKNTCPLTNNDYPPNPVFPENFTIKEFLNELQVKCTNHTQLCSWKGILQNLEGHLKKECGFVIISCENDKCDKKFMRKNLNDHLKNECLFAEIDCVFKSKGCEKRMQRREWIKHLGEVHHQQLKEIIENSDKNEVELNQFKKVIIDQNIELDELRTHVSKNQFTKIMDENVSLKKEIIDLESKIKEICLQLLKKEKEVKLMESRILAIEANNNLISSDSKNSNQFSPPLNVTPQNNNTTGIRPFIKSNTISEDFSSSKKQHTEFNQTLYNYPQMMYNPITGQNPSQISHFNSVSNQPEQTPQYVDPSIYDISAHENSINYLLIFNISDAKKCLASCSLDNQIKIWDLANYQLIKTLQGHVGSVTCLLYMKELYTLVSSSYDNTMRLWNVHTWECIKILDGKAKIRSLLNYATPSKFLSGGDDKKVKLWNIDIGNYSYENLANLDAEVSALEIVEFDKIYEVLAGDSKGFVYLINDDIKGSYFKSFMSKVVKSGKCHDSKILCLKYVMENKSFISCGLGDGRLKIREKNSFQLITELPICGSGNCINDIKYDDSLKLAIIGTSDERIITISTIDWNIKKIYEKEGYGVNNIVSNLESGFIISSGALRDKKDGKFKYIIRIRKIL